MFSAEVTIVCESVKKGCEFRALFFDRATERFYGGSGATALEALAWCMDEYIGRVVYGLGIEPARNANATPGSRFPEKPIAPAPPMTIEPTTTTATKKKRRSRKAA